MKEVCRLKITTTVRRLVRYQPPAVRAFCPVCGCEVAALGEATAVEVLAADHLMPDGPPTIATSRLPVGDEPEAEKPNLPRAKMRTKRCLKYVLSGALILLAGWLFLGVYEHREFADKYLFLKHRPTFKFYFYAPLGESDGTLNDLDPELRYEEMMFQEFVEGRGP